MIGAVSAATAGLRAASDRFDGAAARVADAGTGGPADLVTTVVDTLAAKDGVALNAAVLRAALDMQKRIVDILV